MSQAWQSSISTGSSASSTSSSRINKHIPSINAMHSSTDPQFLSNVAPEPPPENTDPLLNDNFGTHQLLSEQILVDYLPSEPNGLRRSKRPHKPTEKILAAQEPVTRPSKCRRLDDGSLNLALPAQPEPEIFETDLDAMGLFRRYTTLPSTDPDQKLTIHHIADAPTFIKHQESNERTPLSVFRPHVAATTPTTSTTFFAPFLNATVFRLMNWFYQSTTKTLADLDNLVHDVILQPDFSIHDLEGFSASRESKRLEKDTMPHSHSHSTSTDNELPYSTTDNWRTTVIEVPLPLVRMRHRNEQAAPKLSVPVIHRDILEVVESLLKDFSFQNHHLRGFKQFWRPSPDKPKQRVYSEVYNTDIFLGMEEGLPSIEGCNLEKIVVPLLIYSDSTHLANFGTASLWPIYLWTGCLSKYTRIKPSSFATHHLAYLPSIPEMIQDIYIKLFNQAAPASNYVERIIIACMKQNGHQFCATCTVTSRQAQLLGTKRHDVVYASRRRTDSVIEQQRVEKARAKIFKQGYVADGKPIDNILKDSKTPIRNAFSQLLLPNGENFYNLFVVDVLHEIELGVIKHTFAHLIRMLYTLGAGSVAQLDRNYRRISTFGRSTIRKFSNNVSEMKKLAGRDFEDILQCAGPCFEGFFRRKIDSKIQDLLFIAAAWHASAKLRVHTDNTLDIFRGLTREFTRQIQYFATQICPHFDTIATPAEAATSLRAAAAKMKKNGDHTVGSILSTSGSKRMAKTFKIDTPKFHSIVHYPESIARYGTTDSYSTQMQIGMHERRQARLQAINRLHSSVELDAVPEDLRNVDDLPFSDPERHHHMSRGKSVPLNVFKWIKAHDNDEAIEGFYKGLIDHLLERLLRPGFSITPEDRAKILLLGGVMYYHKALRINFTTYDNRRDQDTVNPRTHSDIMVLSNDSSVHPYRYARILGVYHTNIRFDSSRSKCRNLQTMEFLWVRWYELDGKAKASFEAKRQFQIKFCRGARAFGFIDPGNVIRAVHLIPNFSRGRTTEFLKHSMARHPDKKDQDYKRYYVNMFVDRDMYMRYTGGGIGHRNTREATEHFEIDIRRLWGSRLRTDGSDAGGSETQSESSADSSDESDSTEGDESEDPFASVGDESDGHESEDESDDELRSDDEENPQMDDGECIHETESSLGYEI
ncbi:hypothetical protein H0H92_004278 [Tricholoma furcatifolium]|nr:hypothetical protein H0H92_004278 [Tricholoma furcatifolium]